jgi:hypothetical protein
MRAGAPPPPTARRSCPAAAFLTTQPVHPSRQRREAQASLTYLRLVDDAYWEHSWRREHRAGGVYPEQHLWEAVHGYLDLLGAVDKRHTNGGRDG